MCYIPGHTLPARGMMYGMSLSCQINVDDSSCRDQQSGQREIDTSKNPCVEGKTCSAILLSNGGDHGAVAAETPHHSNILDTFDSIEDRSAVLSSEAFSDVSDLSVRDVSMRAADALRYNSVTSSSLIGTLARHTGWDGDQLALRLHPTL